jgi:sugar lactone lactonase YvrE
MKVHKLDVPHCMAGEGPVWDVAEQALYFVDIVGRKVHRHDPVSSRNRSWEVPKVIGSLALRERGRAISWRCRMACMRSTSTVAR